MNTATVIRCSKLPLAWLCAESLNGDDDGPRVEELGEPAELGTAAHRYMAAHVMGMPEPDIDELAAQHGVDRDELAMLCSMGRSRWARIKPMIDGAQLFAEQHVEADLNDGLGIEGTADVIAARESDGILSVFDFKSGRLDSDYGHQIRGYMLAGRDWCADIVGFQPRLVVGVTVWLRTGDIDVIKLSPDELDDWSSEFSRRLRDGVGVYSPGGHCGRCPRQRECPARRELVQATLADLSIEGLPVLDWTPEVRAELGPQMNTVRDRLKLATDLLDRLNSMLREDVAKFGPLPISDDRVLKLIGVKRRNIDLALARPVLAEYLTPDQLDAALSVSASDVDKAIMQNADRGRGASTKRELAERLEQAGALTYTETQSLREGKAQ